MEYLNEITIGLVITIIGGLVLRYIFGIGKKDETIPGGGKGGNAKVEGSYSVAVGGIGGRGGPGGKGGAGGGAEAKGDNAFVMGGEGGEAGQADRGGRGGRSPLEILGIPNQKLSDGTYLWDKGKGGDGAGPMKASEELTTARDITKHKAENN